MARKKVRLEYIENDTARRVTYKKRVKGVIKKTKELSVLCGVDACAVIYGPYDRAPVVWPTNPAESKRILREYKHKPEMDQAQRRFNQQSYLKHCVAKAQDRLQKLQRRNREMEMEMLMADLLAGKPIEQINPSDLPDLLWVIDDKLRCISHRIGVLEAPAEPEGDGNDTSDDAADANANANTNANANANADTNAGTDEGVNETTVGESGNLRGINSVIGNLPPWEVDPSLLPSPSVEDWIFLP